MRTINDNTPICAWTESELIEFYSRQMTPLLENIVKKCIREILHKDESPYIYGYKAIADYFNVSLRTVANYKNSWLAPALSQRGKNVQMDKQQADELFCAYKRKQKNNRKTNKGG